MAGHTCSRLPKKFQWRNGCSCSLTGQFVGFVSRAGLGTCSRSSFWHETARNARPNIMFALGKRHGHSGVVYHQLPGQQQDCLPFCEQDRSRRSQFFLCRTASDLHMLLQLLLGLPISFLCRWRLCCLVFSNVPVRASSHFQCGRAARIQWYVGSEPAKSILKTQKNQINFLYETGEVIFCWLYIQMHSS